jgi:hypothetical protein
LREQFQHSLGEENDMRDHPEAVPAKTVPPLKWNDPDLRPDQFLYNRMGPWPQPSPTHPMEQAAEVLNIPPLEQFIWNEQIGARYLELGLGYPPAAAAIAAEAWALDLPTDTKFDALMLKTCYQRFKKPLTQADRDRISTAGVAVAYKYDFSAMKLVTPSDGMHCEPMVCYFEELPGVSAHCVLIEFRATGVKEQILAKQGSAPWNLAKVFSLQAAAYHMLFVVHPALHFPMDSVNAITKTSVPHVHPLFQIIFPHTAYTLPLDNTVLESSESLIGATAQGTWTDPFMGGAYDLKRLFGAGYGGLDDPYYNGAYPPYDFWKPWKDTETVYGMCLTQYFNMAFLPFANEVAGYILKSEFGDPRDPYVMRWMNYNAQFVKGFPACKPGEDIDPAVFAKALAIYLWDVTVSHAADHYSFALQVDAPIPPLNIEGVRNISAAYKFLRIRAPRPAAPDWGAGYTRVNQVCNADDLYRAELAQEIFFMPVALKPNLAETYYATAEFPLLLMQKLFHYNLDAADQKVQQYKDQIDFIRLNAGTDKVPGPVYELTIPASIQY